MSETPDTDTYIRMLRLSDVLRDGVIRSAIWALGLPPGSRGLDAGCGIGHHTLMLAEVVGPGGHVTGLDLSPQFLAYAGRSVEEAGMSGRVTFRKGDMDRLPFEDGTFDWAWSVDAAWLRPKVEEIVRVVKPGGTVAILLWSSQQLLPGYPLLEARLNATPAGIAPFSAGMKPESHPLRMLGWLQEAGMKGPEASTFVGSAHAPLSDEARDALASLFDMRWGDVRSELEPEDWEEYQTLCDPDSPDCILNLPDYYAFFTYSMFHGRR